MIRRQAAFPGADVLQRTQAVQQPRGEIAEADAHPRRAVAPRRFHHLRGVLQGIRKIAAGTARGEAVEQHLADSVALLETIDPFVELPLQPVVLDLFYRRLVRGRCVRLPAASHIVPH